VPVFSHVDVRVRDRERAIAFYDKLFEVLGGRRNHGEHFTTWSRKMKGGLSDGGDSYDWFGITEDAAMTPGSSRIAFHAPDRETVDRVAAMLDGLGGWTLEWDEGDYGENYYAVFFEDPDGNPLEVACYEHPKKKKKD